MNELGEALKALFARLGSFFDLFDLSFLVSGSVTLAALMTWAHLAGKKLPFLLEGWTRTAVMILGCYVLGLICFAIGRWIRIPKRRAKQVDNFHTLFERVLAAHGLASEAPFKEYIDRTDLRGTRRLYIRLWAEIRQADQLTPSLLVLNRYWVMAATYDGLATSLVVWALMFSFWSAGVGISPALSLKAGLPFSVVFVLCAYFCTREANRFVQNQVEELVATIALHRVKTMK